MVVNLLRLDQLAQVERLVIRPLNRSKLFVLSNPWPSLLCRSAHQTEDLCELRCFVLTLEKDLIDGKLCKNAAHRPDINWRRVLVHLEQQLRASIVQRHDTLSVRFDRN